MKKIVKLFLAITFAVITIFSLHANVNAAETTKKHHLYLCHSYGLGEQAMLTIEEGPVTYHPQGAPEDYTVTSTNPSLYVFDCVYGIFDFFDETYNGNVKEWYAILVYDNGMFDSGVLSNQGSSLSSIYIDNKDIYLLPYLIELADGSKFRPTSVEFCTGVDESFFALTQYKNVDGELSDITDIPGIWNVAHPINNKLVDSWDVYTESSGSWTLVDTITKGTPGVTDPNRDFKFVAKINQDTCEHVAGEWITEQDSTCTTEGTKYNVCTICDKRLNEGVIPKKEHQASSWVIKENATCTKKGKKEKTCTVCKEVLQTEEIPVIPHTPGEWIVEQEATCISQGVKYNVCTMCGATQNQEVIPMIDHTPGEWIITERPTCSKKGKQEKRCEVCSEVLQSEEIDVIAHTPGEWIVEQEATCTSQGVKYKVCTKCGVTLNQEVIPQLSHNWTDATCITPKTCSLCGETEGTALGHNFIDATNYSPKRCSRCGVLIGDINVTNRLGFTNTYFASIGTIIKNSKELDDAEFYLHTFVVDSLPNEPVDVVILYDVDEYRSTALFIFNFYYLLSDSKIYFYFNNDWICFTDVESYSYLGVEVIYGGLVTSQDEVTLVEGKNYFYFEKPTRKIVYHFSNDTTQEVDYVNWSTFNDFELPNELIFIGTYTDSNYENNILDNGLSSDFATYKSEINWAHNEKNLYVKTKKILGIKYYYENEVIKQDDAFTFSSQLWDLKSFDKSNMCVFESLHMFCYDNNISMDEIKDINQLKSLYLNYINYLENEFYVEIDILKIHEQFFYGSTKIYKNVSSFLTLDEIKSLLLKKVKKCDCEKAITIKDKTYVGNGNTVGSYILMLTINQENVIVNIEVLSTIHSDYIYENVFYFTNKLTPEQIVSDMKIINLLPNVNLTTTFNAKNDVSKKYMSEETTTPGTYSFIVDYLATSGESGNSSIELNVLNPIDKTTEDVEKKINWKDIVVPIIVIGSIVVILFLIFGRKRRYRRR